MDLAIFIGTWSKDPKHKIGAVLTDADNNVLSSGYNGFPRGVADDHRLLNKNKEIKNQLIVHAEANAIVAAARNGHSLRHATLYCNMPPCSQCAGLIIQAGIKKVVFFSNTTDTWADNMAFAKDMLEKEAYI